MSKYNYEINYEEAIKQGISKEGYSREASKNCIQTWIANELAEANRLKRLEIRRIVMDFNIKNPDENWWQSPTGQQTIKDLTDQA